MIRPPPLVPDSTSGLVIETPEAVATNPQTVVFELPMVIVVATAYTELASERLIRVKSEPVRPAPVIAIVLPLPPDTLPAMVRVVVALGARVNATLGLNMIGDVRVAAALLVSVYPVRL
jgi:hypothetical protein